LKVSRQDNYLCFYRLFLYWLKWVDYFINKRRDLSTPISKKYNMLQTPKGTRDLLPEEMEKLQKTIDIIRRIFERYGFLQLETPAFESFDLLSAKGGLGESVKDEIYYFKDKAERELGLRFDLTMPLARVIMNNPNLPKPFKRYQIGKVWRYDNPQALRWREFWQADIDIVGSSSTMADVECLAAVVDCLKALDFKDFFIRINNRKLWQKIFESLYDKEKVIETFRILDKMDKIGEEDVKKELDSKGLNSKKILEMINKKGSNEEKIKDIKKDYKENEGIKELEEILRYAKLFGIEDKIKIDWKLFRGLEYYTGSVFEVMIEEAKVSCGGGGRYDSLIKTIGGPDLPATGISLGLDRIVSFIKDFKNSEKRVFVASVSNSLRERALEISQELRRKGIVSDIDLMERNISKQLEYADSLKYPNVVIVGPKELEKDSVKLRDMKTGKEKLIKIKELVKSI